MVTTCGVVCFFQWATYIPTIVAGLPLNIASLGFLFFRIRRLNESMVYLINLVISDCLLIFSLPFKIYAYDRQWNLGQGFCTFLESLVFVNIYGSIAFIVCIAVDRYIALKRIFRVKHRWSTRMASLVCIVVWIVILTARIPVYSLHRDNPHNCFQNFSNKTWHKVGLIVSMEGIFITSAVIMIFCSVQVVVILTSMRERNPLDQKLRNNQSITIVLSNLITFIVCFVPYHIAAFLYFMRKNNFFEGTSMRALRNFVHISTCLSSLNCLFDGISYYFILKENWESEESERRQQAESIKVQKTDTRTGRYWQRLSANILMRSSQDSQVEN